MEINNMKTQLVCGIKNYYVENGFKNILIGLSGGLDSSLVLALACEAIGPQNIHTFMLKTKYTSKQSIQLAQKAANLNTVKHTEINIQPIVDSFLKNIPLNRSNPVTEQNIQARTRGVVLMMYANEYNSLLLACSNKSEASVGYCTLYGDVCGGLSPIGDIFKTDVYKLANLLNQEGKYLIPTEIIQRPPTAELTNNQKDTDSLPPYEVLDKILKDHIFDNKPIDKKNAELINSIQKKYKLSAFKRAQMPPVITIKKWVVIHSFFIFLEYLVYNRQNNP